MSRGDEIIQKVINIEKLKNEVNAIEVMLLQGKFDSEKVEDTLRLNKVVSIGKIEVLKKKLDPIVRKYLN